MTEKALDWEELVVADPSVCHGQACIKGTRVLVSVVLDNLAAGVPESEILNSCPTISPESIQAAVAYAADLVRERLVGMPA